MVDCLLRSPAGRSNDIACLMIVWPEQRSLPAFYGVLFTFDILVSGGIKEHFNSKAASVRSKGDSWKNDFCTPVR